MLDNAVKLYDSNQYKNLGTTCVSFLDNLARFSEAFSSNDPVEKFKVEMTVGRFSPQAQFARVACGALRQINPNVSPTYA